MSQPYQPLHHKYRPQRFSDLVGQEAIAATLTQAIITNRIAPAYLFSGPRGTGKTSSARIFARSLNCLNSEEPTPTPCGTCAICTSIATGTALDIIEIDAASNTGVENIRELIERSRFAPVKARWKVYVIDECHMLSTAAFNALLKTLEEPPPKVVFVMATTDPQRVLPTILSRCQRFDFRRIPSKALEDRLKMIASHEEISIQPEALRLIAERAQGGLRDAESLLDQLSLLPQPIKTTAVWELLGTVPEQELLKLVNFLSTKNPVLLLETCRSLLDQGSDPGAILQGFATILRDLVLVNAAPDKPELCSLSQDCHGELISLASQVDPQQLLEWQSQLKGTESQLRHSLQPRLWLEVLLLGLLAKNKNQFESSDSKDKDLKQQEIKASMTSINSKVNNNGKDLLIKNNNQELSFTPPQSDLTPKLDSEKKDLNELWKQILGSLELPSTRMLLSQQAKLVRITSDRAVIQVASNWMGMVQSRVNLLEEAVQKALGTHKQIILEMQNEKKASEKPLPENSIAIEQTKKQSHSSFNSQTINTPNQSSEKKKDIKPQANMSSQERDSQAPNSAQELEQIDNQAKNLADFFNGKVLDIEL